MDGYAFSLLVGIGIFLYYLNKRIEGLRAKISDLQKKIAVHSDDEKSRILGGAYPVFSRHEIEFAYDFYAKLEADHEGLHREAKEKLNNDDIEKGVKELKLIGRTESEIKTMASELIQNIFETNLSYQRYKQLIQLNCDALSGKQTVEELRKLDPGGMIAIRALRDPDCIAAKRAMAEEIARIYTSK